jgi:Rod binding domain-containing protein
MNPIGPIGSPLLAHAAQAAPALAKPAPVDPGVLKAAKDFESIFVRQMLKSLEKTTAAGAGTKASPGQSTYGSMIVDTLSESISAGGGLGLSDVIAKSMMASHPSLKAPVSAGSPGAAPETGLVPTLKAPK